MGKRRWAELWALLHRSGGSQGVPRNPDGTKVETLINGSTRRPEGLAVDVASGRIYIAPFARNVERFNLSGASELRGDSRKL